MAAGVTPKLWEMLDMLGNTSELGVRKRGGVMKAE